ncbi:RWD domain-containing protein [Toxoplasma gondii RUB]|uniref:RWD domain-containing protein n=8 Tax=Toxoplasma gondii TaxID=5811 RepID=A0A0F7UUG0_TOXGV|nr:RWD domain-containing protein [Toxoplasma gondii GT1]KAF4645950.1 RWD domain-containing protein [Toxoplasma gondii]KFG29302.1 RWD domain-containing protein [Toxoplasma gondii p89]KFG49504.1 RWD domain-containing protein [Toxoplasma gondii FOU]KFG60568.1 RWD domain-containing protein [Toxoplasma gondii RUB]KFH05603.1 RWD domain-containing protein [Toxoplasma gondii VAND]KFH15515.1 RWD domain-containing protein [Toxoplasma gondii MAS]PUA88247.1 RWD domain-containing protein [Toxoplasma gond
MTNHTEEQALELEALEALFTREEEFEKLSPTSFRLSLLPCQEGEGTDHVAVTLLVEYVPTYPDDPPHWEIQSSKGLDTEALEELKKEVSEAMKREVGAPMMYTIAEFVQDWLRERNKPQQSMYDQMMSRENAAVVEDESDEEEEEGDGDEPQYTGLGDKQLCAATERCTKEEFDRWAERFRQEMIDAGIWKGSAISGSRKGALTGKQLFERDASLATADTSCAEAEAEADGVDENQKNSHGTGDTEKRMFWKDESLFEGEDDEELLSD